MIALLNVVTLITNLMWSSGAKIRLQGVLNSDTVIRQSLCHTIARLHCLQFTMDSLVHKVHVLKLLTAIEVTNRYTQNPHATINLVPVACNGACSHRHL